MDGIAILVWLEQQACEIVKMLYLHVGLSEDFVKDLGKSFLYE
jgi:hypothetical protein